MSFALPAKPVRFWSVLVAVCVLCVTTFASTADWWHGLSQTGRNSRILTRAQADSGRYVGVQCKAWVQNVVYGASREVVWLPANRSNLYQWGSSSNVYAHPHPYPTTWCRPGQIIQMRWQNQSNGNVYPHTAIVVGTTSTGMYWIDSNWQGDCRVRTHFVSHSQFTACVGSNYTIYEVR